MPLRVVRGHGRGASAAQRRRRRLIGPGRARCDTRQVDVRTRNRVTVAGRAGGPTLVFAHGFGCDQSMWRLVSPAFERDHQVVLFDHVGAGGSDLTEWSPDRYTSLEGYARDVVEMCEELDLRDVVFVGHSV